MYHPIITSFYSLPVLSKSGLQVPLYLTYEYLVTNFAVDLVDYRSLLLLWYLLLHMGQGLSQVVDWFKDSLNPKGCTGLL